MAEQITKAEFSEVMQQSYIDYSMSVITARAVPDVRDGLKPVQRRVLFAMNELGLNYDRPHRKSARIVGDTMGKYHPHGDTSIYDALVVLEQDFKKGMTLVDGHGNFGSIEGDGAAAMRYTEAKLKKFTQELYLADLDKDVVDFIPNFDETEREPEILPVRVPNLLINGAEGIAVGMTTSIPTHNLVEVISAVTAVLDNDQITTKELLQYIKGPDFPTGGAVINESELADIYESGHGKLKLRGKVDYEPSKNKTDKDKLVISEIPYTMIGNNIIKFISDIVGLIESKDITDVTDISNESSKDGIRIVLELKRNTDVERLKNILYKKTKLQDTFGVNMLAIVDGRPKVLSLKEIITHHLDFQFDLLSRKYQTLLNKDLEQKEIKEGLIRAYDIIDLIIEILRGSKTLKEAKACMISGDVGNISFKTKASKEAAKKLNFTEKQAGAILELRLMKLIGLEIMALQKEYKEILARIADYQDILENRKSMVRVMKKDYAKIVKEYGLPRKTIIKEDQEVAYTERQFVEEEVVFLMDRLGYAKTIDVPLYEKNKESVDQEYKYIFTCMNTDKICIFTDNGNLHQVKVLDIPSGKLKDKGQPMDNLGNYDSSGENIILLTNLAHIKNKLLFFTTALGMMKKVQGSEFDVIKRTITSSKLMEGDLILSIKIVEEDWEEMMVVQTEGGIFLRFALGEVPQKKKAAIGVRGIRLGEDDRVSNVYLPSLEQMNTIVYKEKEIILSKLKLGKRDSKGVKVRIS